MQHNLVLKKKKSLPGSQEILSVPNRVTPLGKSWLLSSTSAFEMDLLGL